MAQWGLVTLELRKHFAAFNRLSVEDGRDQGTYRCSINNKESINIRLSITAEKREISDSSGLLITLSICVALLLFIVIGQSALIYKLLHNRTQGSASTNTERGTQNIADDDYDNDPSGARNKISMAAGSHNVCCPCDPQPWTLPTPSWGAAPEVTVPSHPAWLPLHRASTGQVCPFELQQSTDPIHYLAQAFFYHTGALPW
ncbi:hypothetical protein SRHO_G00140830 [Serrasalmus rhombeus]